jgi:hypothetical protein
MDVERTKWENGDGYIEKGRGRESRCGYKELYILEEQKWIYAEEREREIHIQAGRIEVDIQRKIQERKTEMDMGRDTGWESINGI